MTVARSQIVDLTVTRYYHCISRCVRGAHLCGEGYEHRKPWVEKRLEELAGIFNISVCAYAVLDSHIHSVVRMENREALDALSDRQIVVRWGKLYPPRDKNRKPLPITKKWIDEQLGRPGWVEKIRFRLGNLGWFMKCLKQPLATMANREDGTKGHFFEARYKSIAILDELSLLATLAYVDLNPVAAGLTEIVEQSPHTSIKARVGYCRIRGRLVNLVDAMKVTADGCVLDPELAERLEGKIWLCHLAEGNASEEASTRPGMISGFSLAQYLHLLDATSRLMREGKARVGPHVRSIMSRLGTTIDQWQLTCQRLWERPGPLGVAFAFSRERLRQFASHRGVHHMANLNGCQAI